MGRIIWRGAFRRVGILDRLVSLSNSTLTLIFSKIIAINSTLANRTGSTGHWLEFVVVAY